MNRRDSETETLIPVTGGGFDDVAHSLRAEGFDASEDGTGRGTPLVPVCGHESGQGWWNQDEIAGTLRADGDNRPSRPSNIVAYSIQERAVSENLQNGPGGKGFQEEVAYTLEARHHTQSVVTRGVRRLTPRECERLQGFSDDFTLVPYNGKPAADGPRYQAIGNSMAVPVINWIGRRIISSIGA